MGFFDDRVKLITKVFSRPDYLVTGEFTVKIVKMEEIPLTEQKKVEGAAITVEVLKSNTDKYKVGTQYSLTFLSGKSEGFLRLKRFFKEVTGATDAEMEIPKFYQDHFPKTTKAPLEGCIFEISGRDKETKESKEKITDPNLKKYYTEFKFGEGRFES